jgi:dolichol-phosphate mannosyltransferase
VTTHTPIPKLCGLPDRPGMGPDPVLSFVVPVYGSPESLEPLRDRIHAVCADLALGYEIVFVDDRCPKGSWRMLQRLADKDPGVVAVRLSRNFGQHAAIQAGLARVRGQWVVVMDCDLQDRPEEVPALLRKALEGYDVVRARRSLRRDAWHRRLVSHLFYRLLGYLTGTTQDSTVANFGVYRRKVIDVITDWHEETKYFPAIIEWVGFARAEVDVEHGERHSGKSSYTFSKLLSLAMNVVVSFSDKPLKLVMSVGFAMAALSLLVSLATLVAYFTGSVVVEGWASIMLSMWFLGGCLLAALGLTGLYVGRILVEAKGRPAFVIDEVVTRGENAGLGRIPTEVAARMSAS